MSEKYRRGSGQVLGKGSRKVLELGNNVYFRCPCDERTVYITSPPHTITFEDDGTLTLDGSVGSHEDKGKGRPSNWCHFNVKSGEVEMHSDSICPGQYIYTEGGS